MNKILSSEGDQSFEALRQTNEHGAVYWSARDLQNMLGYGQWRRFEDAIKRAMTSCETAGNQADYHFAGASKVICAAPQNRLPIAVRSTGADGLRTRY